MKKSRNKIVLIIMIVLVTVVVSGCIPGDGKASADNTAGFFWGVWHGWLAPLSLIISIFNRDIRIYEVYNSGWWYDFGYYMAIISGFGGLALSRKKKCSSGSGGE